MPIRKLGGNTTGLPNILAYIASLMYDKLWDATINNQHYIIVIMLCRMLQQRWRRKRWLHRRSWC